MPHLKNTQGRPKYIETEKLKLKKLLAPSNNLPHSIVCKAGMFDNEQCFALYNQSSQLNYFSDVRDYYINFYVLETVTGYADRGNIYDDILLFFCC